MLMEKEEIYREDLESILGRRSPSANQETGITIADPRPTTEPTLLDTNG